MCFAFRAERRAAPKPARLAMCERLNAVRIAVPAGTDWRARVQRGATGRGVNGQRLMLAMT
jgi:hypothetical protein